MMPHLFNWPMLCDLMLISLLSLWLGWSNQGCAWWRVPASLFTQMTPIPFSMPSSRNSSLSYSLGFGMQKLTMLPLLPGWSAWNLLAGTSLSILTTDCPLAWTLSMLVSLQIQRSASPIRCSFWVRFIVLYFLNRMDTNLYLYTSYLVSCSCSNTPWVETMNFIGPGPHHE